MFPTHVVVGGDSTLVTVHDLRGCRPHEPVASFRPACMSNIGRSLSGSAALRHRMFREHVTRAHWSIDGTRIVATYNDGLVYMFDAINGVQASTYDTWAAKSSTSSPGTTDSREGFQTNEEDEEAAEPLLPLSQGMAPSQESQGAAEQAPVPVPASSSSSDSSKDGDSHDDSSGGSDSSEEESEGSDAGEYAVRFRSALSDSDVEVDMDEGDDDGSDSDESEGITSPTPASASTSNLHIMSEMLYGTSVLATRRYYGQGRPNTSVSNGSVGTWMARFSGHRNNDTVKGVSFMGSRSEYVVSGSDCGNIFFWEAATGELIQMVFGDRWVMGAGYWVWQRWVRVLPRMCIMCCAQAGCREFLGPTPAPPSVICGLWA
jgi:hypothetical protein